MSSGAFRLDAFPLDAFPFDAEVRFTERDDQLHVVGDAAVDWTETMWWSFNVPERSLAGWLYTQVRPNLGTSSGGAFVYGPGAWLPWELPYYGWFSHQPLPDPLDLREVEFRSGVRVRMVEPAMSYELGYRFRDQDDFVADLRFDGLTPPVPHVEGAPPFTGSSHYDQHGRVTGTLQLHGERIPVDCFAVRDRSWGRRPEHIGRGARRLSYVFGTVSPDEMFLVFTLPVSDRPDEDVQGLSSGYLVRGNRLRRLAEVTRRDERDPLTGAISRLRLAGQDDDGRALEVTGHAMSRMALPSSGLCINTLLHFDVDGREGWGEDQDVWPMAQFAEGRMPRDDGPRRDPP
ncbi:MAG: hypothetical protein ACHQNA_01795 [Acidimicrobiales bacterium]